MDRYTIVIQANDGAGPDHWVGSHSASASDKFAKWIHRETRAAVNVYDTKYGNSRLTLGNFHPERT
jgi:hypothetical protein